MKFFAFSTVAAISTAMLLTVVPAHAADKPAKTAGAAEQIIQKFDKNGDKALDATELGAAMAEHREQHAKKTGKPAKEPKAAAPEALIKRFDTNGDGKLDAAELKTMLEALRTEHEERKKAVATP
jgi:Ca2+-binding EF-hand superfamily protein